MKIFLSHSSTDEKVALEVCGLVEENGHSCFYAPRDIRSGCVYAEEIINGIDNSEVMLLLLSSEANGSPHVLREVERAVSRRIPIVVYKLEEVTLSKSMEYFLMTHQWVNAKAGKGYSDIVQCLNVLDGGEKPSVDIASTKVASQQDSKKRTVAILSICAAVLIIGGIATAAALHSGDRDDIITTTEAESQENAGVDAERAPSVTGSTATTTSAAAEAVTANTSMSQTATTTAGSAEDTTTTDATTTGSVQEIAPDIDAELGDTIILGEYSGEPIEWRIISISDDGKTAMLIADDILTMKAYDAAESGKFNSADGESYWNVPISELDAELQRQLRGDNRWELSNLRTWLNSERENVVYSGQAPTSQAMSECKNGYNTEAGFLNGFSDEALSALVVTDVDTNGVITQDRVYLLSSSEMELLTNADVSVDTEPTAAATEQDASGWYELYSADFGVKDHFWWLRDAEIPDGYENACEVNVVGNSYTGNKIFGDSASLEGYGVRPVITVDLTSEYITID